MKKLLIALTLLSSFSSFAGEKEFRWAQDNGFSNNFNTTSSIDSIIQHTEENKVVDMVLIRNLLSGDIYVKNLLDPFCLTALLADSRFLSDMAVGKELTGFDVKEFKNQDMGSDYVKLIPIYKNESSNHYDFICLLK